MTGAAQNAHLPDNSSICRHSYTFTTSAMHNSQPVHTHMPKTHPQQPANHTHTHGVLTQDAYKLDCCWQPSKEQATHYTHAPTPCYTVVDRDEANSTLSSATLNKPWCSRRTTQKVLMYIETLTSRPCSRKSLPHHIAQPQKSTKAPGTATCCATATLQPLSRYISCTADTSSLKADELQC